MFFEVVNIKKNIKLLSLSFLAFLFLIILAMGSILITIWIVTDDTPEKNFLSYNSFGIFIFLLCLLSTTLITFGLVLLKKFLLKEYSFKMKNIIEFYKDVTTIITIILTLYSNMFKATYVGPASKYEESNFNITMWAITFAIISLSINVIYFFSYKLKKLLQNN